MLRAAKRRGFPGWLVLLAGAAALVCSTPAFGVSCTVAAAMDASARAALFHASTELGGEVIAGNTTALRLHAIPSFAASFNDVSSTVSDLAPELGGARLVVTNMYALDAADLKSAQDDVQFFCGLPGAQLLVTVTIPSLPAGHFALVLEHALDVKQPQQFALILQNTATAGAPPAWQLAGFFARQLTLAGHDSVWFWQQARLLKARGDSWGAFFYYQAAAYLARPVELYTSPNLDKLSRETAAAEPQGLPGQKPMLLSAGGQTYDVTGLRVDDGLGSLDLRVDVRVAAVADPVGARKTALDVMGALLAQHPGLRSSFHGIWVYETAPGGRSFAVEQPMSALP